MRADAQADLSLRWAHTHFVDFVMSCHIFSWTVVQKSNIKKYFINLTKIYALPPINLLKLRDNCSPTPKVNCNIPGCLLKQYSKKLPGNDTQLAWPCYPPEIVTVWFMVFSTWFFVDSIENNKAWFKKHTRPVNLQFFLTDHLRFFFNRKKVLSQNLRKQFLYWKLHAFYSAILMSCFRHEVNNVKERRNTGDLAPKILTL